MALTAAQRRRIAGYDRDNRVCARIILADIKKYGDEGSLAVQWARTVQSKSQSTWSENEHDLLFDDQPEKETAESVCLGRF